MALSNYAGIIRGMKTNGMICNEIAANLSRQFASKEVFLRGILDGGSLRRTFYTEKNDTLDQLKNNTLICYS